VCGKDDTTAALQDLLLYAIKGIAMYAHRARRLGATDDALDVFVIEALFTTVTNVNFDPDRLTALIRRAAGMIARARALYGEACRKAGTKPEILGGPAAWEPAAGLRGSLPRRGR